MRNFILTLALAFLTIATASAQTARPRTATQTPKTSATTPRLSLVANAAVAGSSFTTLTTAWSYTANAPTCPASGTLANCFNGFSVSLSQGSTVVFTQAGGQGSGQLGPTATSAVFTPTGGVAFGTYTATVTAVGFDTNGNAITSSPVTATLVVGLTTLNPPTGVTLTAH